MYQREHIVGGMAEQPRNAGAEALFRAGMIVFAVYNVGLAVFMAISPHAFFRAVGPFEELNRHYIRDVATFYAALGIGFAVAIGRPSWRVPVLAITTVQFALHTINHLVDASSAHPRWTGWFDFFSLLASTLLLAWMWRFAAREDQASGAGGSGLPETAAEAAPPRPALSPSPRTERSTT